MSTKTCPYCIAQIPVEARKCQHCGEWVEASPAAATAPKPGAEAAPPPVAAPPLLTPEMCPWCGLPFEPNVVLCVACGYDVRTGKRHRGALAEEPDPTLFGPQATNDKPRNSLLLGLASVAVGGLAWVLALTVGPAMGLLITLTLILGVVLGGVALLLAAFALIELRRGPVPGRTRWLALGGMIASIAGVALIAVPYLRGLPEFNPAKYQATHLDHLRQLAVALQAYHEVHGQLPPAASTSADGRPLLSWRVAVLPYLEQDALYREFHLDEPWDSPHNQTLLARMPEVFRLPGQAARPPYATVYQALTGVGAAFEGNTGVRLGDIIDGPKNTLLIAEAAEPVPWTKPDDLVYQPGQTLPNLGKRTGSRAAVTADGTPRMLDRRIDDHQLRALITRNGGEPVP